MAVPKPVLTQARLADYESIVGKGTIEQLQVLAEPLANVSVEHVNSTYVGGGVAEILSRMVPLLHDVGVTCTWEVIQGTPEFFAVTKKIHNALHGRGDDLDERDIECYMAVTDENLKTFPLTADILFLHDPQPAGLVQRKPELGRKWLWRCHIDVSHPQPKVWQFLERFVVQHDAVIFSAPAFSRPLPLPQFLVAPSIDPLSLKNKEIPRETVSRTFEKYGVPRHKPTITQISRFDRLKDPVGVIQAFRMVRRTIECQLVLAGGPATDDPESGAVFEEVKSRAKDMPDVYLLEVPAGSDLEINALQQGSDIILQKSLAEGFALTVSEALWKGKPVVASAVGGIPQQVIHRFTGLLTHTIEGTAAAIRELLNNPSYGRWLGENGREHVRKNFLLTRHLRDYLAVFNFLVHGNHLETIDLASGRKHWSIV